MAWGLINIVCSLLEYLGTVCSLSAIIRCPGDICYFTGYTLLRRRSLGKAMENGRTTWNELTLLDWSVRTQP